MSESTTDKSWVGAVGAAMLAIAAGCGGGAVQDDAAPDGAPPPPDAALDDASVCAEGTVRWPMTVHSGIRTGPVVEGVHGSVVDWPEIVGDTDADGLWEPCLPVDEDLALSFEKDDFLPTLFAIRTGDEPPDKERHTTIVIHDNESASFMWNQLGVDLPATDLALALVQFLEHKPDYNWFPDCLVGGSATPDPAAEVGPGYIDNYGHYDPDQHQTGPAYCEAYLGFRPDSDQVEEVLLTLSHDTLGSCRHIDGGWQGPTANTVRLPVKRGFRTWFHVDCQ